MRDPQYHRQVRLCLEQPAKLKKDSRKFGHDLAAAAVVGLHKLVPGSCRNLFLASRRETSAA